MQPITRALLRIELTITPDFQFDPKVHDGAQLFHILVEDVDGEKVLHHEPFMLKIAYAEEEHAITFAVPIQDPLPPQYFLRVVSDRWIHSRVRHFHLLSPPHPSSKICASYRAPRPPASACRRTARQHCERLYADRFRHFNPIQTQTFSSLYETDENVLVCAPTGSGKTICAEFALLRMLANSAAVAVCVRGTQLRHLAPALPRLGPKVWGPGLGKAVVELTGETVADLRLLERGQIIVTTAERWDVLSRRWKQRKAVQDVSLFIVDELHLIGGLTDQCSRLWLRACDTFHRSWRNVFASWGSRHPLRTPRALAIGRTTSHSLFSFHSNVRPVPLELCLRLRHQPLRIALARDGEAGVQRSCGARRECADRRLRAKPQAMPADGD